MTRLKAALVGCGYFATFQAQAWAELDEVEMVALCDPDPARRAAISAIFGDAPRHYSDLHQLLAAEEIDFVDICTRVETHEELVATVAAAGVHIICQKPLAADLDAAARMRDAVHAAGVRHMVHENFRFQPGMRRLKDLLPKVGRPVFARISFRSGFDVYASQPYLADDPRFIALDLGVHLIDLARFFMGEVAGQAVQLQRVNKTIRGEDTATFLLRHESGAVSVVDMSYGTVPERELFPQTLVHLEGSEGTLILDADYNLRLTTRTGQLNEQVPPGSAPWFSPPGEVVQSSVRAIQRHWVDALQSGRQIETDFDDNLQTLKIIYEAYEGAEVLECA